MLSISVLLRRLVLTTPALTRPRHQAACRWSRYASTEASTSKHQQVPPSQQPATSPDKTSDPLATSLEDHDIIPDSATASLSETANQPSQQGQSQAQESDEYMQMSDQEKEILAKLNKAFPGGSLAVQDVSGGCGTFYAISIESESFKGLSKIKQHQKVNKVLADDVKSWHGMQLKTAVPE